MSAGRTPLPVRGWRLIHLAVLLLEGMVRLLCVYPFLSHLARIDMMHRWSLRAARALNLQIEVRGVPPLDRAHPALIVANHVSWLDVVVISVVSPARFVAKSEIREWPLLGLLSDRAGTIFIERRRRQDTGRVNEIIRTALEEGDRVALFPEGTTTDGRFMHRFHASLLQPAITVGAMLYPAAVRYVNADGSVNIDAAYWGDMSLLSSILLLVAQRDVRVQVTFAPPIPTERRKRRELARDVEQVIANALSVEVAHRTPGKGGDLPGARPTEPPPTGTRCPEPVAVPPAADRALTSARK